MCRHTADTAGSHPDHGERANTARVKWIFWFLSAYKFILHSIKCTVALCLKNNVYVLIKKDFIAEEC